MPVTDNRILVSNADTTTNWDDEAGSPTGFSQDLETFIEGAASLSTIYRSTTVEEGLLYDFGTTQDFSNTVWYSWFNFAVPSVLQLKANHGVTIRFCGATITNWFEYDVAGIDTYQGGWEQFVASTHNTPDRTNGTPPNANAIRWVGTVIAPLTAAPKNATNTFIDALWYIKNDKPATTIYGNHGGGWADVIATASLNAWGTVKLGPGGSAVLNGGVQVGTSSNVDTTFETTNQIILWENQPVPDGYYQISVTGSALGSTQFAAGTKVGEGDSAVGISGWVVTAASGSSRYDINTNSNDITTASFYSSVFQHANTFRTEFPTTEFISCQFTDVSSISQSSAVNQEGSLFLNNVFLNANTPSNTALIKTYDPTNIRYNSFVASTGHAIEMIQTGSYVFTGNTNSGFGANDTGTAFLLNSSAGQVTMSIADGGDGLTYRNVGGSTTQVLNTITLTLTGIINDSEVRIFTGSLYPQTELAGQESVTTGQFQYNYEYVAGTKVDVVIFKEGYVFNEPEGRIDNYELLSTNATIPIVQQIDRNYIT